MIQAITRSVERQEDTRSIQLMPLVLLTRVDGVYVDGLSITLGRPHKHVWTYAVGHEDMT